MLAISAMHAQRHRASFKSNNLLNHSNFHQASVLDRKPNFTSRARAARIDVVTELC
jgi:hypothetical protein